MPVWDIPLRLFHGLLALTVSLAWLTGDSGPDWLERHIVIGQFVLGLLLFRFVWGFIGTDTAMYKNFIPGPRQLKADLAGRWQGEGHSPVSGIAVVVITLTLLLQCLSGLVAFNDELDIYGPLYMLMNKSWIAVGQSLHHYGQYSVAIIVATHLLAIFLIYLAKGKSFIVAMVTGGKRDNIPDYIEENVVGLISRFFIACFISSLAIIFLNKLVIF